MTGNGYTFVGLSSLILSIAFPGGAQQPRVFRHVTPVVQLNLVAHTGPGVGLNTTTWRPIGPSPLSTGATFANVSGRIVAIAAHPTDANTIYIAAAGGGVWKTTNGAESWTPLTDSQATVSMGAIAISKTNPSVIYAGTGEANGSSDSNYGRGILISSDGGATWSLSTGPSAVFDRLTTAKIAIDPTNADVAYAAISCPSHGDSFCQHTGIWKTTDRGTTWTNMTASINSTELWLDVVINPSNVEVVYATADTFNVSTRGVYKSTNAGSTWTFLTAAPNGSSIERIAIAIAPSNPQVLYVSATSSSTGGLGQFMRSDNGGATFTDLTSAMPNYLGNQGFYDMTLTVDPTSSAIVYAGGQGLIIRSTNSGVSWTSISNGTNGVTPHGDHHGIAFDANERLLDGNDGGIYRLDDPAAPSWSDLNGDLNTIQFYTVGLHPTDPTKAIGGTQDNGVAVYSGNFAWAETEGGDAGEARFSTTNGNRVYHQWPAALEGNFFRRSDDGGMTWTTKTAGISVDENSQAFYAPFAVDPNNGDRVVYGTNRVWETTSGGDSWTVISPVLTGLAKIAIAPSDVNTIYAAGGGTVFVTTNHGTSWTQSNLPSFYGINDIQADPDDSQIAYAVVATLFSDTSTGHRVFRTTNGGTTWTDITGNLPNEGARSIQIDPTTSPKTLYAGVDDGVFFSTNFGGTWNRFGSGLPAAQVYELQFNKQLLVLAAATHGRGIWEISTAKKRGGQITSE